MEKLKIRSAVIIGEAGWDNAATEETKQPKNYHFNISTNPQHSFVTPKLSFEEIYTVTGSDPATHKYYKAVMDPVTT